MHVRRTIQPSGEPAALPLLSRARTSLIDSDFGPTSTPFRHAALIGKHDAPGMRQILEAIADFLARRGIEVTLESETARRTGLLERPVVEPSEIGIRCDLAIVVGGDGTMLRFARLLAQHGTPLVGINRGRLGRSSSHAHDAADGLRMPEPGAWR